MTATQFDTLKAGDIIFKVEHTGSNGIQSFQYVGIIYNVYEHQHVHLFLSPYFMSTISIAVGKEGTSRSIPKMFGTLAEAQDKIRQLRAEDANRNSTQC